MTKHNMTDKALWRLPFKAPRPHRKIISYRRIMRRLWKQQRVYMLYRKIGRARYVIDGEVL